MVPSEQGSAGLELGLEAIETRQATKDEEKVKAAWRWSGKERAAQGGGQREGALGPFGRRRGDPGWPPGW